MKNMKILTTGLVAATLLFGCATGNKVARTGFGGSWGETTGEKATIAAVESPSTEAPAAVTEVAMPALPATEQVVQTAPEVNNVAASTNQNSYATAPVAAENQHKISKIKAVKTLMKAKKQLKHSNEVENKLLLVIIALFLPWLAVLLYEGSVSSNFWITLLLWFLFYVPGLIYSLLVIFDVI